MQGSIDICARLSIWKTPSVSACLYVGLSLRWHPVEFLYADLAARGVVTAWMRSGVKS